MPEEKEAQVLLLTGPPGVGKTTAARILAGRFDRAVHLEADRFFEFIRSGFVEPWEPESRVQNETVMGIVANAAVAYADAGFFVIVDGIIIPRHFLEPLRAAVRDGGHRSTYVVLRAPLAECAARVAARDAVPPAEPEVLEGLWSDFSELGDLEEHVLDVGELEPGEVAELIHARLGA